MSDTFTWPATSQSTGTTTASVKRVRFGDGYGQSVADGLNATARSYQLQFVGTRSTISDIVAFLDGHVGQSFLWHGPLGTGLYYCTTYTDSHLGGTVSSITATFEQTFQP
ncbi:phage tail protein [Stenotrophomonas sp. 24(2023)]|uniref:phage tail protein n=1 Tax=Stenotrophomonas sp. 24(2023) TaxID=3068324 RepID=UPI0027E12DCD|nr:phage tail protein [Stenotrophomonas sp. 24(2023)]WMJ71315.1 phage tail protein [Stenotrophomonas sp. 24(2023)]